MMRGPHEVTTPAVPTRNPLRLLLVIKVVPFSPDVFLLGVVGVPLFAVATRCSPHTTLVRTHVAGGERTSYLPYGPPDWKPAVPTVAREQTGAAP